jgi:hypothetical protein
MAATPSPDVFKRAQALLREGKNQEADDLLEKAQADADAAAGKAPEPKPPRAPAEVLREILGELADAHGNHPRVQALLAEFDAAEKK